MVELNKEYICPKTHTKLTIEKDNFIANSDTSEPIEYEYTDILDFTYPKELFEQDRKEQLSYNDAYQRYDRGVTWVFESLNSNENETRAKMAAMLNLKPGMKVLEVGAGTGKDSEFIIKAISPGGSVFLSDLSPNMLRLAKKRLQSDTTQINYFIANGAYLPFADNTFDAVFHFGGINTFAERKKAFNEFNRVAKIGATIVIGDESVAPWLRNEPSYKTLMAANPMFADKVPLQDVPKNIYDFQLNWIFGFGYYLMSYKKGDQTPTVNTELQIPDKDYTDNWRIRAEKNLNKT